MSDSSGESFEVDLEPKDRYYRQDVSDLIRHGRARTANQLAIILVAGVVLSLPLYLLTIWASPAVTGELEAVFEKWYAVVSPLAGTAIGAYYGARSERAYRGAD